MPLDARNGHDFPISEYLIGRLCRLMCGKATPFQSRCLQSSSQKIRGALPGKPEAFRTSGGKAAKAFKSIPTEFATCQKCFQCPQKNQKNPRGLGSNSVSAHRAHRMQSSCSC